MLSISFLFCILVLFGQRPDEAIKAFLETSDWTLSTKISPPSVTYDAHYLCTVSLRGHKNIVKPIRMGIRRGEKIVVNRQLCIAITAIGIAHNISITIEATIPNILLTFIYILFLLCYIFIFIIILLL